MGFGSPGTNECASKHVASRHHCLILSFWSVNHLQMKPNPWIFVGVRAVIPLTRLGSQASNFKLSTSEISTPVSWYYSFVCVCVCVSVNVCVREREREKAVCISWMCLLLIDRLSGYLRLVPFTNIQAQQSQKNTQDENAKLLALATRWNSSPKK